MGGLVMSAIESRLDAESTALRKELASLDGRTWAHHRFLATELANLSSSLAERGVKHYLIKGLAVETQFYDRTGERPCADLDIVLMPSASVASALDALGYTSHDPRLVQRLAHGSWIQSVEVRLPSGVVVDLHFDPLKLGFQSHFSKTVRQHLTTITMDGQTIETLDPTASLIVALVHLNRNRFRHLSGFADVARMLRRADIAWDDFEHLVYGDGMEALIEGSLCAVRDELELEEDLVTGWSPRNTPGLALRRMVWGMAWSPSTRLTGTAGMFRMGRRSQFLLPALCRGRLPWLIWWVTRRLFPPHAVLELNHPGVSGPYLLRLIRGRWGATRRSQSHRHADAKRRGHLADEKLVEPSE